MEQEQEQDKNENKVKIFGHYRSRKELLINGIVFLLMQMSYKVFNIVTQLPEGYKDNPDFLEGFELEQPSLIISMVLFFVGYVLIDKSVFGSDVKKNMKKYGKSGYFRRKISLALVIILLISVSDALMALIIFA